MEKSFETFYKSLGHDKIEQEWKKLKEEYRNKKTKAYVTMLIVDILLVGVLYYFLFCKIIIENFLIIQLIPIVFLIIVLLMIDALIYGIMTSKIHSGYLKLYKKEIVENILKNFFEKVNYNPDGDMPKNIYNENKEYEYYDIYYSDDYMEGIIDNKYSIQMADVTTQEEEETRNSKGETETRVITLFSGLFAKINLKKSIEGKLVIKHNNSIMREERLEMDSNEFEKYFDVSTSDKIKGMQLLTHDIMELLVEFRVQNEITYDLVIENNNMYIRLDTGSLFESSFNSKKVIDERLTKKYYDAVEFIYSLAKTMIKNVEEAQL